MKKILKYILTLRYVKLISYISAKHLQESRQDSHKHRYTYYYGFQVIYGAINKGLFLILLGLIFNILPQLIIVSLSFVSLRIWVGGLHFDSYTKCAYVSLLSFLTMSLLAKYVILPITIIIIIFIIMFSLCLLYAPIENKNRPLKEKDKKKFKIISLIILSTFFLIIINTHNTMIINCITYGVLLSGIISLPIVNNVEKYMKS